MIFLAELGTSFHNHISYHNNFVGIYFRESALKYITKCVIVITAVLKIEDLLGSYHFIISNLNNNIIYCVLIVSKSAYVFHSWFNKHDITQLQWLDPNVSVFQRFSVKLLSWIYFLSVPPVITYEASYMTL